MKTKAEKKPHNKHAPRWMELLAEKSGDIRPVRMAIAKRVKKDRVQYYISRLVVHGFLPATAAKCQVKKQGSIKILKKIA